MTTAAPAGAPARPAGTEEQVNEEQVTEPALPGAVLRAIRAGAAARHALAGLQGRPAMLKPGMPPHGRPAILMEETGNAARELTRDRHDGDGHDDLREQLINLAAMAGSRAASIPGDGAWPPPPPPLTATATADPAAATLPAEGRC